jgi:CheY-like chemotaxis protein
MDKPRILIVDDEPKRSVAGPPARLEGFEVAVAKAANGPWRLAVTNALVITDLKMGGMDGMALFDTIQRIIRCCGGSILRPRRSPTRWPLRGVACSAI